MVVNLPFDYKMYHLSEQFMQFSLKTCKIKTYVLPRKQTSVAYIHGQIVYAKLTNQSARFTQVML